MASIEDGNNEDFPAPGAEEQQNAEEIAKQQSPDLHEDGDEEKEEGGELIQN